MSLFVAFFSSRFPTILAFIIPNSNLGRGQTACNLLPESSRDFVSWKEAIINFQFQYLCVGRKISREEATKKKYRKIANKTENSTFKPLSGGWGATKKIAKIGRKIELLSLYLLYLYHVWKFRGATAFFSILWIIQWGFL